MMTIYQAVDEKQRSTIDFVMIILAFGFCCAVVGLRRDSILKDEMPSSVKFVHEHGQHCKYKYFINLFYCTFS